MTSYLITGGTGSMGQALTRELLTRPATGRVCVYSRDEWKQAEMRNAIPDKRVRFFIGDVRDRERLELAMDGVTHVIHAAALKQVPACEFNPIEAVNTNVLGTENVIKASRAANVGRVLMLSSDKACDPTNLYGATKLCAEKLMVAANVYAKNGFPRFACTRYGNVIGSRGSVLPLFQAQHAAGQALTVTDPGMTRFVLTLEQGVQFVLESLEGMEGGEVFVPKLPAVTVRTIAEAAVWPALPRVTVSGHRSGEKRHEVLVSTHEAARTTDMGDRYVIGLTSTPGAAADLGFSSDTAERLGMQRFRHLAGLTEALEEEEAA